MMSKSYLAAVLLGLAGVLSVAEAAQAQVRIVVGVGGRGPGYGYGPGYYSRGYYAPPRYYYPPPLVIGVGPRDPYYPPRDVYYPPPIVRTVEVPQSVEPPPAVASNAAQIRVLVPDAQAKVWFDGNLTSQGGTDRLYHTPTLDPTGKYSYRIRASWVQNNEQMVQEQVVPVRPGETAVADFTRPVPSSEPLALPK